MTRTISKARLRRAVLPLVPRSRGQLQNWLRLGLDLQVPGAALCDGGSSPLDYLWHAFHEPVGGKPDCVVWACRGGGKTFYAAVATLLDLLFKPGIEVKLLGGSLDQSQRMHEHLRRLFEKPHLRDRLDGRVTARGLRLLNGSTAEVLAQSHTAVRGARPQKLRCDEAELFDPEVWRAAQLCPRSRRCGETWVHAGIEALSTAHQPFGLMSELINSCRDPWDADSRGASRRLFKWGVVDVLSTCPPERPCEPCPLLPECAGRAKRARGHITIDDAIAMKSRVGKQDWDAEMLCLAPRRSDAVLPEFDPARHVRDFDPPAPSADESVLWLAGMDFGFRAPTVFLWAFLDGAGALHVIDEHSRSALILDEHIQAIRAKPWPRPEWVAVDPAGAQVDAQTGVSHSAVLHAAGYHIKHRASPIEMGLRLLRARLAPAAGEPRLFIHPRCRVLIESLVKYHYPPPGPGNPDAAQPVKDGPDHAVDALRYLVISLDAPHRTTQSNYLSHL